MLKGTFKLYGVLWNMCKCVATSYEGYSSFRMWRKHACGKVKVKCVAVEAGGSEVQIFIRNYIKFYYYIKTYIVCNVTIFEIFFISTSFCSCPR